HFGKLGHFVAHKFRSQQRARIGLRHVKRRQFHPSLARRGLLEDQPLVLADVPPRLFDLARHQTGISRIFRTASPNRSSSLREVVYVTHARPHLVSRGSIGPRGSGPMIFSLSSAPLIIRTERGKSTVNSLNTGPLNARFTPGIFSSSVSAKFAF